MELVTPSLGLIFWQLIMILTIGLFVVAWMMILISKRLESSQKIVWLIGTLFLPVVGPLIFFIKFPSLKKTSI